MATATVITASLAKRRLFTVDEYHRMGDAGILGEDDRVELLRGEILEMSRINPPHNGTVNVLNARLTGPLLGRAVVQVQGPIRLNDLSEPQPDIALLRWRDDGYTTQPVMAADVLVVMEVAFSSLAYDRDIKGIDYAISNIPEYWLWDIPGQALLVHRDPHEDGYHQVMVLRGVQSATPIPFPDIILAADGVIPALSAG